MTEDEDRADGVIGVSCLPDMSRPPWRTYIHAYRLISTVVPEGRAERLEREQTKCTSRVVRAASKGFWKEGKMGKTGQARDCGGTVQTLQRGEWDGEGRAV